MSYILDRWTIVRSAKRENWFSMEMDRIYAMAPFQAMPSAPTGCASRSGELWKYQRRSTLRSWKRNSNRKDEQSYCQRTLLNRKFDFRNAIVWCVLFVILCDSYSIGTRLRGLEFFVDGTLKESKREITLAITKMDGRVGSIVTERTAAIISDAEGIEKMGPFMKNARDLKIQVVPVGFLDDVKIADPFSLIKDLNLSPWQCIDVSSYSLL